VYVPEDAPVTQQGTPKASGTLASHYAPNAPVRLMEADALKAAVKMLLAVTHPAGSPRIAVYAAMPAPTAAQSRRSPVLWRTQPTDAESCAQELFAVLREWDAQGVSLIWVQTPPATPEWDGVRDRLQRAAA
jgi:L-threonylcarbamoyladenylate synthase